MRLLAILLLAVMCGCAQKENEALWVQTNYSMTTENKKTGVETIRHVEFKLGHDGNVKWRLGKVVEK